MYIVIIMNANFFMRDLHSDLFVITNKKVINHVRLDILIGILPYASIIQ